MLWIPSTYDIVTILIELQVESDGIVRTTAKAVVLRMVAPRVYNLLHNNYLIKFMFSSVITYYLITNKYHYKSTKNDGKRVSLQ
jgi:hypothetical protein